MDGSLRAKKAVRLHLNLGWKVWMLNGLSQHGLPDKAESRAPALLKYARQQVRRNNAQNHRRA